MIQLFDISVLYCNAVLYCDIVLQAWQNAWCSITISLVDYNFVVDIIAMGHAMSYNTLQNVYTINR